MGTFRAHNWRPKLPLNPPVMSGSVHRGALWREDRAELAGQVCTQQGPALGCEGLELPQTYAASVTAAGGSAGKPHHHPPSFFIPARKHFLSLQYRHWFLLSLSTTHCLLNLVRERGVRSRKSEPEGRTRYSSSKICSEQVPRGSP